MPNVALLVSLYWPDATSRAMWQDAVRSLRMQPNLDVRLFVRIVGDDEAWYDPVGTWLAAQKNWLSPAYCNGVREREPQPVTWNTLYQSACYDGCDYLAILNADDAWLACGLTLLVRALRETPDATLAYGDYRMWYGTHKAGKPWPGTTHHVLKPSEGDVRQDPVCGPFWACPMEAARKVELEPGVLFDESLKRCADHHLWIRLARLGRMVYVDRPVGLFLNRPDSLFHGDRQAAWQERLRVREFGKRHLGA